MVWYAGFDIGMRNFAFAVVDIDTINNEKNIQSIDTVYEYFQIVDLQNIDVTVSTAMTNNDEKGSKKTTRTKIKATEMMDIFRNVYEVLDSFQHLWNECEFFVIEQQMQFRHASNIKALKLSQHVISYFLLKLPLKKVVEYPSYHKTQIWKAPYKLKKHERKKWSIETVQELLMKKNEEDVLASFKKKDDVCDCILMVLAYAFS